MLSRFAGGFGVHFAWLDGKYCLANGGFELRTGLTTSDFVNNVGLINKYFPDFVRIVTEGSLLPPALLAINMVGAGVLGVLVVLDFVIAE